MTMWIWSDGTSGHPSISSIASGCIGTPVNFVSLGYAFGQLSLSSAPSVKSTSSVAPSGQPSIVRDSCHTLRDCCRTLRDSSPRVVLWDSRSRVVLEDSRFRVAVWGSHFSVALPISYGPSRLLMSVSYPSGGWSISSDHCGSKVVVQQDARKSRVLLRAVVSLECAFGHPSLSSAPLVQSTSLVAPSGQPWI